MAFQLWSGGPSLSPLVCIRRLFITFYLAVGGLILTQFSLSALLCKWTRFSSSSQNSQFVVFYNNDISFGLLSRGLFEICSVLNCGGLLLRQLFRTRTSPVGNSITTHSMTGKLNKDIHIRGLVFAQNDVCQSVFGKRDFKVYHYLSCSQEYYKNFSSTSISLAIITGCVGEELWKCCNSIIFMRPCR